MRPSRGTLSLLVLLLTTTACTSGDGTSSAEAVQAAPLEEAGTATLDGDDIVVQLSGGSIRLTPADDTTYFVCDGPDDCEVVDETTFRGEVTEGATIRVLGPNAELLTADAERLPEQLWVVLDRDAG